VELVASSVEPRRCGEKVTTGMIGPAAPISPFITAKHPVRFGILRTVTDLTATNQQPFKKLAIQVSNH
jgi:hypothetical protein